MKHLFICATLLFSFASCSQGIVEPEIIVEPPEPVEIVVDSILQGTLYNVTIGDDAEKVYADLQEFSESLTQRPYLAITGQFNDRIEDLKDRIPLYQSLVFDRKPSSPNGGQIYFEDGIIKSIYNRKGEKLTSWPQSSANALRVGEPVSGIYDKLVKINTDQRFSSFFDYIGMFEKNTKTAYDPVQNRSLLWQYSFGIDEKQFNRVDLVFKDGMLTMIKTRYERYL
ncbi:hypothetical protein [Olivibacter sitiensis]|uniref:hypothetical protein n=1 Tax=Olivibacter sitiensis TaxID=376470 RepID=UPI0004227C58|nr:hypothetical protein [Olivibacter sitiensis]